MSMVRRFVLFATLALFLAAPAAWAQVALTSASYNEEANILTINFDGEVYTTSEYVTPALLSVDDDNGGRNGDLELVAGQVVNVAATGTSVELYLIYGKVLETRNYEIDLDGNTADRDVWGTSNEQAIALEAMNTDNLSLVVADGAFMGTDDVPVAGATVDMAYVATPEADVVTLDSVKYNAFTNVLRLVFSDPVQFDQLPEDISEDNPENPSWPGPGNGVLNGLPDEDLNDNTVLDMETNVRLSQLVFSDEDGGVMTPVSSLDLTRMDSTVLELQLTRPERANLEGLNVSGAIYLTAPAYSFVDVNYNPVAPVQNKVVEYTADTTPAVADSAKYNVGNNQLTVYWSQPMAASISEVTLVPKFYFSRLHGGTVDSTYQLTSAIKTISGDLMSVILNFSSNEQDNRGIEDLIDQAAAGDTYELYIESAASMTNAGNLSLESENVPVRIVPEDNRSFAPEFNGNPSYDAATGIFTVTWNTRIEDDLYLWDPDEGDDGEFTSLLERNMDVTRFHLISGTDTVSLKFEDREYENRALRISGNTGFSFQVLDAERLGIGRFADKDNITINVDPYAVRQFRDRNGNRAIVNAPLDYVADTNVPLVAILWYNTEQGMLVVGSNITIDAHNVDLTKLTSFAGVSGLEFDSTTVIDEKQIGFYLKPSYVSLLNALTYEQQASLSASWDAGLIVNNDGVLTPAQTDVVGGTVFTTAIDEATLTLGFGKSFMITSYEAFPTEPREVRASLQRVSPNGLWYVENGEFSSGSVTPEDLDKVLAFFEDSTQYDATMGAHDLLMNAYTGSTTNELLSETPVFLFVDVWDEYGLGRNDSEDNLWYPGFVESDNNIIYLDSDPADYSGPASDEETGNGLRGLANLYTRYIMDKIDPFESEWMRTGFAFLSEFLVGSRDMVGDPANFVEPDFYNDAPDTQTDGFQGGNSLIFVGSVLKDRVEWEHLYLFFLYVYEQYGEEDILQALATSRRVGVEGFQSVLDQLWAAGTYDGLPWLKDSFDDLYLDFATANLLNLTVDDTKDHGLYKFANASVRQGSEPGVAWKWAPSSRPPYLQTGPDHGFTYFKSAYVPGGGFTLPLLDGPGEILTLSVTDPESNMRFRKVNLNVNLTQFGNLSDFTIQDVELDANGQALVPMDDGDDWIYGSPDSTWATFDNYIVIATNSGSFVADHITNSPVNTDFFVSQNSVYGRKVDLFLIASEAVYNYDGDPYPVITASVDEGDSLRVAVELSGEEDYIVSEVGDAIQYVAHIWMTEEGTFTWNAEGFIANGSPIDIGEPSVMSVSSLKPGQSNLISLGDDASLLTSSAAVDEVRPMNMILNHTTGSALKGNVVVSQNLRSLGTTLQMVVDNKKLNDPAVLTMAFDVDQANGQPVGIFFEHEGAWKYVGGDVDWEAGTVSTTIGKLGNFQVMAGELGEIPQELALPRSFELKQNYPNPFNPSTTIEMVLPRAGDVRLAIYDVLGREVAKLVDGPMRFGNHRIVWNGRSTSGQTLSSGVYFVQMQANSFRDVKKMVLVK